MESLLSVSEAQQRLLAAVSPLDKAMVALENASGRVLAEEIISRIDLPPFDNSSMDGFAVISSDVGEASPQNPVDLEVVADIPAGMNPVIQLRAGQAARIVTGAVIPPGADAVVRVEDTDLGRFLPGSEISRRVRVFQPVNRGDSVRRRGQNLKAGEMVLKPGMRLRPQDVGALAMIGASHIQVYRRPKVGLLSSGDELLPVGSPLEPGKIYETNAYTLGALILQNGGECFSLGTSPDQMEAVRGFLGKAVGEGVDLILSSAGVSMGAFDYVKEVLSQDGELDFWRVNMRPGKPLAFGRYRGIPFIGLPGNPVSAFVGFQVFVRPVLDRLSGLPLQGRPTRDVRLLEDVTSDGRESYLRAIVSIKDGAWEARLTGHQGSGNLLSLVAANALIIIPSGVKFVPVGAVVKAWLLDDH